MPGRNVAGDAVSFQLHEDPRFARNQEQLRQRALGGTRILGGTPVKKGAYLDCLAVGGQDEWGCTGTLVGPRTVLTAGHCRDCATRVFIGNDVTEPGRIVAVERRVRHPDYREDDYANDLMVLLLETAIDDVTPRRLATAALIDEATDGRAVGFGRIDANGEYGYGRKRQADLPIASPDCRGESRGRPDAAHYGCHPGLEIVAGRRGLERDSCSGDSGGPFYIEGPGGEWLLAGATSRATKRAIRTCGDGGVYVRVDAYRDWIESIPGVQLA
jgi:secreted trypsin-like serine protease